MKFYHNGYHFISRRFTEKGVPDENQKTDIKEEIPVFILRTNGELAFFTQFQHPVPDKGDILIAYVRK